MRVKVILNPYANRWRAQARVPDVHRALARADVQSDVVLTTRQQEATQLAQAAAQEDYEAIVAAGGDGTVSEVVNGLILASGNGATRPLGILPIGTGNDFSDMLGIPRDLSAAAAVIGAGQTRRVDAGRVNDRYFNNNCALAMEPMVTIENIKMRRISGKLRYIAALAKALLKLQAWHMRIRWDGGEHEGPIILLSVCNGPRTGGLFYMSPDARVDDGLFDFVLAPDMSKLRILTILPRLFNGSHIKHPLITHHRAPKLTVDSDPGTPIHADGEVIASSVRHIEYETLPGKITLLAP